MSTEPTYVYRVPSTGARVLDFFRSGQHRYPIYPRGMGSVTEEPYFTDEDLAEYAELRKLYDEGMLRKEVRHGGDISTGSGT